MTSSERKHSIQVFHKNKHSRAKDQNENEFILMKANENNVFFV